MAGAWNGILNNALYYMSGKLWNGRTVKPICSENVMLKGYYACEIWKYKIIVVFEWN